MTEQTSTTVQPVITLQALKASCSSCSIQQLCLPMDLSNDDMARLDEILGRRQRIARGDRLFAEGSPFTKLFAIRYGHFKTVRIHASGEQQIMGFQMAGELLGLDAISTERHQCDAVALEDSEVCEIPFDNLQDLFAHVPDLLRHFHRIMSQNISRDQNTMLLLGGMRAEQRFAVFLTNLSMRYASHGYSGTRFQLRMSREDIANYLGLTIESISRILANFKKKGILEVDKRELHLVDAKRIRAIAAGTEPTVSL